jgi:hypothetical protein
MRLRMLAASIPRIVEHRRRRAGSTKGFVVGDVDPTSGDVGLAGGKDGDGGVIAVEPLGREDVTLQGGQNRTEGETGSPHGIGHGR